jgi:hypothetical protein
MLTNELYCTALFPYIFALHKYDISNTRLAAMEACAEGK